MVAQTEVVRGVTITKHGATEVLQVREFELNAPRGSEVRIRVRAAGLNFAEISARQGLYPDAPKPPCVVGYEVAGEIDAIGESVDGLRVGDRVLALTRFGGHASAVVVDQDLVLRMPDKMSFAEAAAIPVNY